MDQFITLTVNGLANGAILALAALGFVIIYKATGVINFAQGQLLLVGAYLVFAGVETFGWPWPAAVLFAMIAGAALGVAVERLVLRPLVGEEPVAVIMVTIGLAAFLQAVVQFIWGTMPQRFPSFIPKGTIQLAGVTVPVDRLVAMAVAAIVLTGFSVFFRYSRSGIAMRAVADDQQAALAMGISVRRVFAISWALAAVSAVIGGALVANLIGVSSDLALFGLAVFPVVIIGGLDSVPGTIVGGLLIGLLISYTAGYVGLGLQTVVPFVVIALVLMGRPYGLFGQARIERV
ncbi:MAG: branched-chain amino acid ABC transporter permease [Egibacteraceae bacterium]